jgi:5-methylcytosine-specific restriction endonuclease McrA/tRNA threonylcarbamoyladenosine modification (KEOPS) complex  Pcc1 subunit
MIDDSEDRSKIESNSQLRAHLKKEVKDLIKSYDLKESERIKTRAGKKFLLRNTQECAACNDYEQYSNRPEICNLITNKTWQLKCTDCKANNISLVAHHIEPLEVGGKTDGDRQYSNLILLCKTCHEKVHKGLISIDKLRELKNKEIPKNGVFRKELTHVRGIPDTAQTIHNEIQPLIQKRFFAKAINIIDCYQSTISDNDQAKYYLLIKKAELTRRRPGKNMRRKALEDLNAIENENVLGLANKLRLYNERAFIYRLLGCHSKAISDSDRVIRLFNERKNNSGYKSDKEGQYQHEHVVASLCKLTCELSLTKNVDNLEKFIGRLETLQNNINQIGEYWKGRCMLNIISNKLKIYIKAKDACKRNNINQIGEYWKGRCMLNIISNKLKIYIKAKDACKSRKTLKELRSLYFKSDVTNGWTESLMDTVSQLTGLVTANFQSSDEEKEESRRLLARAFNARINNNEYFGDIRDIGFALANVIEDDEAADEIRVTMNKTIDGASFIIKPFRKKDCWCVS